LPLAAWYGINFRHSERLGKDEVNELVAEGKKCMAFKMLGMTETNGECAEKMKNEDGCSQGNGFYTYFN
jgi:hypothetical protein